MGEVRETEQAIGRAKNSAEVFRFFKVAAPIILTAVSWGCGVGEKQAESSPSPLTPTTAGKEIGKQPSEEATILPTQEPTPSTLPEPTSTPSVEATTTPTATPTATETPLPAGTEPVNRWLIEIDPASTGPRLPEEDFAIVHSVIEKFPQIGNLKIILTSGEGSHLDRENQTAVIDRNEINAEFFKWKIAHEIGHFLDPVHNRDNLVKILGEAQVDQLTKIRERVLADPLWGRNYPDLEKLFNKNKLVNLQIPFLDPANKYKVESIAAYVKRYADNAWIAKKTENSAAAQSPFLPFLFREFGEIGRLAQEAQGQANFANLGEFLDSQKAKLETLSAQDKLLAVAIDLLGEKRDILTLLNISAASVGPVKVKLHGENLADWWRALPTYVDLVLSEQFIAGNEKVIILIPKDDIRRVGSILKSLKEMADEELWAEINAVTVLFDVETPVAKYIDQLR